MADATAHEGLALVEEMGRRFAAGDRDGALALLHDDFRIEQPASLPHGGWHTGRDGMVAMGTTFAERWDRTISAPTLDAWGDGVVQVSTSSVSLQHPRCRAAASIARSRRRPMPRPRWLSRTTISCRFSRGRAAKVENPSKPLARPSP